MADDYKQLAEQLAERDATIKTLLVRYVEFDTTITALKTQIAERNAAVSGWRKATDDLYKERATAWAALVKWGEKGREYDATIADLREKGKRLVVDRNHWEARASQLEADIAALKAAPPGETGAGSKDQQFRRLKVALAKMFHPDALSKASASERAARETIYKEINAEITRIERTKR
jgi:chromosome segregation ATPase